MSSPTDPWSSLRGLAERAGADQARLWRGWVDLFVPRASPDVATRREGDARRPTLEGVPPSSSGALSPSARLAVDYVTLTARYYRSVAELGLAWLEEVTRASRAGSAPRGAAEAPEHDPVIDLVAVPGRPAGATFRVENLREGPMTADLETSPVPGLDGLQAADLRPTLDPARFVLEPGAARRVTLTVELPVGRFRAGDLLHWLVVDRGDPSMRVHVRVQVSEPAALAAERVEPAEGEA